MPAKYFTPPPKVDSQVVVLTRRAYPLVSSENQGDFFRVVKAGFSSKRKKIKTSLAGGLGISKEETAIMLEKAGIAPDLRAEDLSIEEWAKLAKLK